MHKSLLRLGIALGIAVLALPIIHILMKEVVPVMSKGNRAVSTLGLLVTVCLVALFVFAWAITRE
jgi:hypothetical protein